MVELNDENWRQEGQEPELFGRMKLLGNAVNVLSIVAMIVVLMLGPEHRQLVWLSIAITAVVLVLELAFPAYFTLVDAKTYRRRGYETPAVSLAYGLYISLMTCFARTLVDFSFVSMPRAIAATVVLAAVVVGVLFFCGKEFRYSPKDAAIVLLVAFLCYGLMGQLNYLLDFGGEQTYTAEVTKTWINRGRRSDSYHCSFELDGESYSINISLADYQSLEFGDEIRVTRGEGAFGVEYITLAEEE